MKIASAILGILLIGWLCLYYIRKDNCVGSSSKESQRDGSQAVASPETLCAEYTFGMWTIRTYKEIEEGLSAYEILRNNQQILVEFGVAFFVGSSDGVCVNPLIAPGKDITGDGIPNLVVSRWDGSAHGGIVVTVFEIDDEIQKLATIDAPLGGEFRDLDGDSNLEFVTYDGTFIFLGGVSFADSPFPRVVLRFHKDKGEYTVAADQMQGSCPSPREFADLAQALKAHNHWKTGQPPPELLAKVLDLIYSGQVDLGWKLFDLVWPENVPGKEDLRVEVAEALKRTRYLSLPKTPYGMKSEDISAVKGSP